MKPRLWLRDGWFVFSTFISIIITVFFALPTFFGFQNFVQWGAMYDDRWCTVAQYDKNPHLFPDARVELAFPAVQTERVYSGPSHNRQSCLAQAKAHCGRQTKEGWIVAWSEPELQRVRYTGDTDICAQPLPSLDYWFYYAE